MWTVLIGDEFQPELLQLPIAVQDGIAEMTEVLEIFGPQLGRPRVDTLNKSRHYNMKELRFNASEGVWRVAFAFDTKRKAILLIAGDKAGMSQTKFYRDLIERADDRFDAHLARLKYQERTVAASAKGAGTSKRRK